MSKRWTKPDDEILERLYPLGEKDKLIALLPDRTWKAIKTRATKIKGITYNRRGCHIREDAFSEWSPNMAYLLGYIFADGSISKSKNRRNSWYWQIGSIDKQIIYDIAKYLEWGGKVLVLKHKKSDGYYADYTMYRLSVGSNKMVSDLRRYGVTRNKSLTIQPPRHIPENMISHFIRGYWDGDGTVGDFRGKNTYLLTSVGSGSKEFVYWIANTISTKLNIATPAIDNRNENTFWSFALVGYNAKLLLDWLYKDANLFLERKHKIYKLYDKHGRHPDNLPQKIVTIRSNWGHS